MEEQNKNIEAKKGKDNKKTKDSAKIGIAVAASAALFFGCLFAIESSLNTPSTGNSSIGANSTQISTKPSTSTSDNPVVDVYDPMKETLNMPVKSSINIGRYFYDAKDPVENRENAIVQTQDGYKKSEGIVYQDSKTFEVYACFSGEVTKVLNDSTYGNMIFIEHESGVVAAYSSLGNVNVVENQKVKQGDLIGTSGESNFTKEFTQSLHFSVEKDENMLNPSKAYGQLVKDL